MSYIITDTKLSNIASAVRYKCGVVAGMNITTMINKLSQLKQSAGVIDVSQSTGASALTDAIRIATFDSDIVDTSTMVSMKGMCSGWTSVASLDFQGFDTSSVTDMSAMFRSNKAAALTNLTHFDTSNVTTFREMFEGIGATSLDLSGWDVTNVTLMDYMFDTCHSLNYIDLSGWSTPRVITMEQMFRYLSDAGGKMWVPSTFVAHSCPDNKKPFSKSPFYGTPTGSWRIYTNATDATSPGWGTINSEYTVYYNSTHQDFINA